MLPAVKAISAENALLLTVAVVKVSPLSITPSLSASLKIVTVVPVSPAPEIVSAVVLLVMLSVLDEPESSAAAKSKLVGADGVEASMVIDRAVDAELVLPAKTV